jgi:hypothetical protein
MEDALQDDPNDAELAAPEFRARLERLSLSQSALAVRLRDLGDDRSVETILRSIQRMATGDARVSGEMKVILRLLEQSQLRLRRLANSVQWVDHQDGTVTAEADDFSIFMRAESRSRWSISVRHRDGYSPPWPRWETSLEQAKARALLAIEHGHADLAEIAADRAQQQ